MGIHCLAPSLMAVFSEDNTPPAFATAWSAACKAKSKAKRAKPFGRGVIATDIMPRLHALAASPSAGGESLVASAHGGMLSVASESSNESSLISLSLLVQRICAPTLRLAEMHERCSVVFVGDRSSGNTLRPPKDITRDSRTKVRSESRARRGVTAPKPYARTCRFDVEGGWFIEMDEEGDQVAVTSTIDMCRLLASPHTLCAFYRFFAESTRLQRVFEEVFFDLPGCEDLAAARCEEGVLLATYAPSHAFAEGDNCVLHVQRHCPRDAVFHAITVDTDAVVMMSCVMMLSPENTGAAPLQQVYWHSVVDMSRLPGGGSKERVWAIHCLVECFARHKIAPHAILATAILTGCDFLPHSYSLTNISAESVWRAALDSTASDRVGINYAKDFSAAMVLDQTAFALVTTHNRVAMGFRPLSRDFLLDSYHGRTLVGSREIRCADTELMRTHFAKAWAYLYEGVLANPVLGLDHPLKYMERAGMLGE